MTLDGYSSLGTVLQLRNIVDDTLRVRLIFNCNFFHFCTLWGVHRWPFCQSFLLWWCERGLQSLGVSLLWLQRDGFLREKWCRLFVALFQPEERVVSLTHALRNLVPSLWLVGNLRCSYPTWILSFCNWKWSLIKANTCACLFDGNCWCRHF